MRPCYIGPTRLVMRTHFDLVRFDEISDVKGDNVSSLGRDYALLIGSNSKPDSDSNTIVSIT